MNKMLLVAASAVALAGCNKAPTTTENAASNEAAANAAAATPAAVATNMVTANGSTPGTYEVTMKDGTKGKTTLLADGTYDDVDAKGKETKGKWSVQDGKTCFDPDGDEGPACYKEGAVGADGSFTATSDKGDTVTVKKVG